MVQINKDNCKGCGRCITACPKECLTFDTELNKSGIKAVKYAGDGCISCGICFYNCPEPYALRIEK
jgi:NAD-dependent dihydropyrimidine dehydrogenase PreA subunit